MAIKKGEFWINKQGKEMHPDMIRADEKLRDELVEELIAKAKEKRKILKKFKEEAFGEVESYFELLLEKYNINAKENSRKGNITLENYSGTKKIQIAIQDRIEFDEKLNIAKMKIDEYLHKITQDASPEIKTLITKAFEVDKKGNVNAQKILALKSYEITDPLWIEAMHIIDEATQIVSSKSHIRFYERENPGYEYKLVTLDFSKL